MAAVRGTVVANDGSSANVGGIALHLAGAGFSTTAVTDASGQFDFGPVDHGTCAVEGPDDDDGEAEWTFEDGDLPLDVATIEDLEGLRIEIRDATTGLLLLFGEVPDLPAPLGEQEIEVEALLTPAADVQGTGKVELEQETEDGVTKSEIEFEAEDLTLAEGTVLVVLVEDPASPGTLVEIGTMTVDSEGEAELEFETEEAASSRSA